MANQNKLVKLWKELKRRKVIKVIVLYASTAFILLQIVSLIINPLHLPAWVETFFIVLLVIGFPIAVIFSWIFDVTPEGIEITVASHKTKDSEAVPVPRKKSLITNVIIIVLLTVIGILVFPRIFQNTPGKFINSELEKSIAVLPFKDDSNDSTNVHIINGLMESILNNLSRVKEMRVLSRTSVEKYRNDPKLHIIPEIAQELNVNYIIEGSGQKIGNKLLLTVQLIEAKTDKHLWSEQYSRNATDIFNLQIEVAKAIAAEIKVIITPEEEKRIIKKPTENLVAYDYYLKGKEVLNRDKTMYSKKDNVTEAIRFQRKALEHDGKFALAYAELAILYRSLYYMLNFSGEQYATQILKFANKAMVFDSNLDQSWLAVAAYYNFIEDYELNVLYLEKVLELNPNSSRAIYLLSHIYGYILTDTEKSLEYALKLVKLDVMVEDLDLSIYYLMLAKSARFSGFFLKSLEYIEESIKLNPSNISSQLEKAQLLKDMNENSQQSRLLLSEIMKHSKDIRIVGTLGHMCYLQRDYESAYKYYHILIEKNEGGNYSGFNGHLGRIALVYNEMGMEMEADDLFQKYEQYIESLDSNSLSRFRHLASINSYFNKKEEAFGELMKIKEFEKIPFWIILDLKLDPIYNNMRKLPEFQKLLNEFEKTFWENHSNTKATFEEKGLF